MNICAHIQIKQYIINNAYFDFYSFGFEERRNRHDRPSHDVVLICHRGVGDTALRKHSS